MPILAERPRDFHFRMISELHRIIATIPITKQKVPSKKLLKITEFIKFVETCVQVEIGIAQPSPVPHTHTLY